MFEDWYVMDLFMEIYFKNKVNIYIINFESKILKIDYSEVNIV